MNGKRRLALLLGLLVGFGSEAATEKEATTLPYEELKTFTQVYSLIQQDYVKPVSDRELIQSAIRGMLSGLDPHSAYLSPEEFKELQIGTKGEFGGLGIEVTMENGFVKVIAPIDDTPAQRAGIKAGDLIVRIDDKPVKGMTLQEAVGLMRGKPGTKVTLTILREGEEKPLKITITRDIIRIRSVKWRMLDEGYGYLRISSFQIRTPEQVREAIAEMEKRGALKGVVLDLRNNPGGVLNAAVEVADLFLDDGLIVYTKGRIKEAQMEFRATPGDLIEGVPMVVLINAGSASASEIVAGALQDHRRAILMGQKSFGKGSVQTIMPLSDGGAIKLTTALYYTPSGRSIQADGIVPDIELKRLRLEKVSTAIEPVTEAQLRHHLENGKEKKRERVKEAEAEELLLKDYALHEALNLLKGINILKSQNR